MDAVTRRVDRGSKLIAATPAQIYAAFIEPQALISWLPPDGASGRIEEFEPRPGGAFRMTLTFESATHGKSTSNTDVVNARFADLIPDERVCWAIDFQSDDPAFTGTMMMAWTFTADGSRTRVDVEASDVPVGIAHEDHERAIESSLAHLAAHVEGR